MKGVKLTIPPYTPEFNPIERFFRTLKSRIPEGIIH
jgi:transposase